ncbi:hypothetical protein EM595_1266 [Duffyella gerundensis]|uniref:Uncharacterized protein n=1 Tax=Duffyella gerundensis TaxID=1619313 RepID=A0A0U5LMD2_9GAMM|nr:hypothetical protein EM595_1266 [Duffyella gerundensis]
MPAIAAGIFIFSTRRLFTTLTLNCLLACAFSPVSCMKNRRYSSVPNAIIFNGWCHRLSRDAGHKKFIL